MSDDSGSSGEINTELADKSFMSTQTLVEGIMATNLVPKGDFRREQD